MFKSKNTSTPEQAFMKLKQYCGYQERCHQEVKEKLYSLGLKKIDVERLISLLIEENYLNEERFARLFAGGHFRQKQWGKQKIIYALRQKKLSEYTIKLGLKEIQPIEYEKIAHKLMETKWELLKKEPYRNREAKTTAFMLQRGFEQPLIQSLYPKIRLETHD